MSDVPTHRLKDGTTIAIRDMPDALLIAVVRSLERRALDGMTIRSGGHGWDIDDFWYDEDTITGIEVLHFTNYFEYRKELDYRIGARDRAKEAAMRDALCCPHCLQPYQ